MSQQRLQIVQLYYENGRSVKCLSRAQANLWCT